MNTLFKSQSFSKQASQSMPLTYFTQQG